MKFKISTFLVFVVLSIGLFPLISGFPTQAPVGVGLGTINQISQLFVTGGSVKLASTTATFQIPSLANENCIGTDANGVLQTGTCGSGGGSVATSSSETKGFLPYWTSTAGATATLGSVATTSLTATSPLSLSNAISVLGSSASSLSLATTTDSLFSGSAGQILAYINNGWFGVATTTFSGGLTYSNGNVTSDLGTSIDISTETNLAVTAPATLTGDTIGVDTTGTWSGNAGSATKLQTARTIAGVSFDGTANISLNNNAITNGAGYTTNTGTVTSVALTAPTGLTVTGSPVTSSGTLALAYDTGYGAVLTASTTNWNTFYDTPSSQITSGTGLSWSGNTLNAEVQTSDLHSAVTLSGALDYITLVGQDIVRAAIDLTTDVSGALPIANGGTGATTASAARTNLGVDPAGTDNSTNVTLAGALDYLTIAGQEITRGAIDLATDITGTLGIANGGTGTTTNAVGGQILAWVGSNWQGVATTTFSSGLTYSNGNVTADLGTSIDSSEITDGTIVNADISSSAAIDISKTALTAGTNITLSGNTLNVDDAFLLNTGDTATGDYTFDTSTLVIDSTNNRIGIGTTTPGTLLSLGNTGANTINISATATSTFGSGIDISTGCFAINGTCIGGGGGSGTVTSVAQTVPTGLTVTGSPITSSGTLAIAYDTGYAAVRTASTTNWNTFYDTPSNRITAGTGLSWTSNTLNAEVQTSDLHSAVTLSGALNYITLVGQDIVRGAIDLATDVTGVLPDANVADDITLTNLTQITNRAISDTTGTLAVSRGGTGATTLANLIALGTDTTGNYLATLAGTANQITVTGSGSESATPTLSIPSLFDISQASTTKLSALQAFFGATATTTIDGAGNITLGGTLTVGGDTINEFAGTGLTVSGNALTADLGTSITSSEITDGTILNADISSSAAISVSKTALVAGTNITLSGNTLNVDDAFLLNTGDTSTGNYTFENVFACNGTCPTTPSGTGNLLVESILIAPQGTAPTVTSAGALAIDTSGDDALLVGDGTGTARVVPLKQRIWSVTVASTSPAFIAGSTLAVPVELDGYTMSAIRCKVDGGTSKVINIEDATPNATESITCGTTVTSDDGSITNATVNAAEEMYINFGATTGTVDYVSITVYGYWTRE